MMNPQTRPMLAHLLRRLPLFFALAVGGLVAVFMLNACLSDPKEKTELEFRLDSTLVGKFDSVRVRVLPASGDTTNPLLTRNIALKPGQKSVTITLPDDFDAPGFKVILTGIKDGQVAFDKQYTYIDASTKPQGDPLDLKAERDSTQKADSTAKADSLAQAEKRRLDSLALVEKQRLDSLAAIRTVFTTEDLDCFVDDSVAAKVTVKPDTASDKGFTLVSEDTTRAGTSGSFVLCRDTGEVTVVVRARRDTVTAKFQVAITRRIILLQSLSFASTAAKVGDTLEVIPELLPENADDKSYSMTSDDSLTVKVIDLTHLVALKAGSATLTLKAEQGNAQGTFEVSVTDKAVLPTDITASDTTVLLFDTLTLAPVFTPDNTTERGFALASQDTAKVAVVTVGTGTNALEKLHAKALGQVGLSLRSLADTSVMGSFNVTVRPPTFEDIKPITKKWCGTCHSPTITFNLQDSAVLVGRGSKAMARLSLPVGNTNRMPVDAVMDKRDLDLLMLWLQTHVKPVTAIQAKDTLIAIGDTITPVVTFTPTDATNKGYTLESGNSSVIRVTGATLTALGAGTATITVRSEEGAVTAEFVATGVQPRFDMHVKPIMADKCGKCHGPAITFNLQDSTVLLNKGSEALRRMQLPKSDPAHMPAEGELKPSELNIVLGWLNNHFVRLDSVRVANDTVRLGDTKFPTVTFFPANASNRGYSLTSFDTDKVGTPTGVRIQGKALGAAMVGLTTEEGNKTKSFSVTVIPWPVDSLVGADTSLQVGDSVVPRIEAYPDEATDTSFTLTTLNAPIATLTASGKVRGVALGTAKIVATSVQNPTVKDTFDVVVGPVPLQSITVAPMSLLVGATAAPSITFTPAATSNKVYALSFVSGTVGIATISGTGNTTLTGVAAGTATYRVTAADSAGGVKTANFTLTVGNVVATAINLTLPTLVVGTTAATSATFTPSNATIKTYTLATSNSNVLGISGTSVVIKALGSATITATAADGPTNAKVGTVIMPPFTAAVRPILVNKCASCHPGLALPNWSDSATAFANRVTAFDRINRTPGSSGHMPMGGTLTATELQTLNNWFKW